MMCNFAVGYCHQVETSQVIVKEGGVQLKLTIVDTPGFGEAVDNSSWSVNDVFNLYHILAVSTILL
jgi:septin family protein